MQGLIGRDYLGSGVNYIKSTVGELDFIGWSDKSRSLILFECKILQDGTEPRMWKNHVDAFIKGKDREPPFVTKLGNKRKWVCDNSAAICDALRSEGLTIDGKATCVNAAFITYAPEAASNFIEEFPCVSLPEFVESFGMSHKWTHTIGSYPV